MDDVSDCRLKGFDTLKEFAQWELFKRTSLDYDASKDRRGDHEVPYGMTRKEWEDELPPGKTRKEWQNDKMIEWLKERRKNG